MKMRSLISSLIFSIFRASILFAISVIEVARYLISPYGFRSSSAQRLTRIELAGANRNTLISEMGDRGPICLFAAHTNRISISSIEYIRMFKDLGFRVMHVNNRESSSQLIDALSPLVWRAFDRPNLGQDIGAYKDGILWLEAQGYLKNCTALAVVNDSMQFIPGKYAMNMSERIDLFLDSTSPALFSHVSQQVMPHYQSFFQILKPEVFLSREYISFWRHYIPYSHRSHCIYRGEIGISRLVYNGLARSTTLYTSEALSQHLLSSCRDKNGISADDLLYLMPAPYRTIIEEIENPALDQLMRARVSGRTLLKSELACISELIENSNPSHVAAFLFPVYLHCPLLKRDLCFAGSFTIGQAANIYRHALLASLGESSEPSVLMEGLIQEYVECLYAKGVPQGYSRMRVRAIRKGLAKGFLYSPTFVL